MCRLADVFRSTAWYLSLCSWRGNALSSHGCHTYKEKAHATRSNRLGNGGGSTSAASEGPGRADWAALRGCLSGRPEDRCCPPTRGVGHRAQPPPEGTSLAGKLGPGGGRAKLPPVARGLRGVVRRQIGARAEYYTFWEKALV